LSQNEFSKSQQLQIQECIRTFQVELKHLNPLKKAFIKTDKAKCGIITLKDLVKRLVKMKQYVPEPIFNFFAHTLAERDENGNELQAETKLHFSRLQSLYQIYYNCPVSTKGYTNNSNIMREALTMPGHLDDIGFVQEGHHRSKSLNQEALITNRMQQLLRQIHQRFE
jgi:hypothetical protein